MPLTRKSFANRHSQTICKIQPPGKIVENVAVASLVQNFPTDRRAFCKQRGFCPGSKKDAIRAFSESIQLTVDFHLQPFDPAKNPLRHAIPPEHRNLLTVSILHSQRAAAAFARIGCIVFEFLNSLPSKTSSPQAKHRKKLPFFEIRY